MPTTETGRLPPAVALLAALLALGGCDGGIFGTGDGSPLPVEPPSATTPTDRPSDSTDGDDIDSPIDTGDAGDLEETPAAEGDPADPSTSDPDASFAERPLINTLVADPSAAAPRLRVLNASTSNVALFVDGVDGADGVGLPFVPAGTASTHVSVPEGVQGLVLGPVRTAGDEPEPSSRFAPLLLDRTSVTTLLVRDTPSGASGPSVTALPTLRTSGDPALALVRLVTDGALAADGIPVRPSAYTLVPAGANPGGVEIALGIVAPGDVPSADYLSVPAGDYRLEGTGAAAPALSFAGGSVGTLVVFASGELLVVDDGD